MTPVPVNRPVIGPGEMTVPTADVARRWRQSVLDDIHRDAGVFTWPAAPMSMEVIGLVCCPQKRNIPTGSEPEAHHRDSRQRRGSDSARVGYVMGRLRRRRVRLTRVRLWRIGKVATASQFYRKTGPARPGVMFRRAVQ
jgi:hypothetical protein